MRLQLKTNWLRGLLVLGVGTGGSMALCLGAFDLVAHDPKEGFGLLRAWGPWALIVGLVAVLVWKLVDRAIGVVRVGLDAWVGSTERGVAAQERTADAIAKVAEQGGKQHEEVRRLAIYAAQEFPSIYSRFDTQDVILQSTHELLAKLATQVETLTSRAGRNEG